jgi:branched-chain amino acid transport system substrate-binding protein
MKIIKLLRGAVLSTAVLLFCVGTPQAAEPIRLLTIEALSGPAAGTGKPWVDMLQYAVDEFNKDSDILGHKIELMVWDNGSNAEKTTELMRRAVDEGIRYITQGIGSNHALNIINFIDRHNKREPEKSILYLNNSAGAVNLTNKDCSFWHFRFADGADMYSAALVSAILRDGTAKRIYMQDMNYSLGQTFNETVQRLLKEKGSAIEVVGNDMIAPFGKVQDFTPYVAKIRQANADTVVTSSWDVDLIRLYKATAAAGLKVKFYTTYGANPVHVVAFTPEELRQTPMSTRAYLTPNDPRNPPRWSSFYENFEKKYKTTYNAEVMVYMIDMLKAAMERAKSTDPLKVALALEEVSVPMPLGEIRFRKNDHQITMPILFVELTDAAPKKVVVEGKNTGIGAVTKHTIPASESMQPTTCKMTRP